MANSYVLINYRVFRQPEASYFRERKAADCHCWPSNLWNIMFIRYLSSKMNHSKSMLPLPHLNQLVHLPEVFAGQMPSAFSGLHIRVCWTAEAGLAHLAVPMQSHWEDGLKPVTTFINSKALTITITRSHHTDQAGCDRLCRSTRNKVSWDQPQTFCCIILMANFSEVPKAHFENRKFSKIPGWWDSGCRVPKLRATPYLLSSQLSNMGTALGVNTPRLRHRLGSPHERYHWLMRSLARHFAFPHCTLLSEAFLKTHRQTGLEFQKKNLYLKSRQKFRRTF